MDKVMQMLKEFLELASTARAKGDKSLALFYMRKADSLMG